MSYYHCKLNQRRRGQSRRRLVRCGIHRADPGDAGLSFGQQLQLLFRGDAIDALIERHPDEARYFVGKVFWRPGELKQEMARGLWHVLPVSTEIVFRKDTESMWKDLDAAASMLSAGLEAPLQVALH